MVEHPFQVDVSAFAVVCNKRDKTFLQTFETHLPLSPPVLHSVSAGLLESSAVLLHLHSRSHCRMNIPPSHCDPAVG